ncbi:TPA: hypothetical protein QDB28_005223 [Burkholderia vietnamiensis]|uniref:hypothetical protein n=1 Tax=Burkholderia vietnamiensis TaxID=60552 RepID=UPI00158BAB37|nr:hypothetical protein [Burkholderia vietnamiensis]HDR9164788.1 hypothetical protein [Burkholderia vietnamiensis]
MKDVEDSFRNQIDELSMTLGQAIWAFARVERVTYLYMKQLSTDTLDVLMADQSIPTRIRVIKHLINRATGPESIKQQALTCLKRIHALAEKRNLIAHNPWSTYLDLDAGEFVGEIEKVTDASEVISKAELEKFSRDALDLAANFESALSELRYHHK